MKKLLFTALVAMLSFTAVKAQNYNWAVGLRGGYTSGITAKAIVGGNALEAIASFHRGYDHPDSNKSYGESLGLTVLYEWREPVITRGFNVYYGLGGYTRLGEFFGGGAVAVAGLEYKIPNVPLAVSVDYKPYVGVWKNISLGSCLYDFGFGLKFTF